MAVPSTFPLSLDSFVDPIAIAPGQYVWLDGSIRDGIGASANVLMPSNPALIHSRQHALYHSAFTALETKVGLTNSIDVNSLDYKLKNVASLDPGHQHTHLDHGLIVDSFTKIGTVAFPGKDGTTDPNGVDLTYGTGVKKGLFGEISDVLSLGNNVSQIGARDSSKTGGIFRLDMREGAPWFVLYRQEAITGNFFLDFQITETGLTQVGNYAEGEIDIGQLNVRPVGNIPAGIYRTIDSGDNDVLIKVGENGSNIQFSISGANSPNTTYNVVTNTWTAGAFVGSGAGLTNLPAANITGRLGFNHITQGSALSVLGVTGNSTADNASIAAASDGQVLRRSGTAVAFGAVNLASANAVTGQLPTANVANLSGTNTGDVTLAGENYLSRVNQVITANAVNLASSNVTGDLPFANIAQIAATSFAGNSTGSLADIAAISAATAKTMLGYQFGVDATGEVAFTSSISGSSTVTQNITLSNADWTNGLLIIKDSTTGNISTGGVIHFGTLVTESAGVSALSAYASGAGYIGQCKTKLNVLDGVVTDLAFQGASGAGTQGSIQIQSVRINGTNLEIIWKNSTGTSKTVTATGRYFVMRGDKVTA